MEFIAAHDLDEALAAKAQQPDAQLLAGGTDLMVEVNLAHYRPSRVLSLRRVEELRELSDGRIGAGVTWARLEKDGKGRPPGPGPGGENCGFSSDPCCGDDRWQCCDGESGR